MRTPTLMAFVGLVLMCWGCARLERADEYAFWTKGDVAADALRCEYRVDPLGMDQTQPRLSWIMRSKTRGQKQTAYQVLVAGCPKLLRTNQGDLWDTGRVQSDQSNQIEYRGTPLTSQVQCYWKVRVWDKDGKVSRWSKPALWTMGLLDSAEWKAKWIGFEASRKRAPAHQQVSLAQSKWIWYPLGEPARAAAPGTCYFRKVFTIPEGRAIKRAVCAVTADNRFKMFLNGRRVRNGENFSEALAGDLAEHLRSGTNVIAIEATNDGNTPNPAGVIAVLKVEFMDGSPLTVVSDASWSCRTEARLGWINAQFDDKGWKQAGVAAAFGQEPWQNVTIVSGDLFLPPAQHLRKTFVLDKRVQRATLYASALGNYELYLNGKQVSDAYFLPGWTDYDVRVYYNTFDVTGMVRKGGNAVGAILADGWYSGHIGWKHIRDHYGKDPRFAAQLHVEYADGTSRVIASDRTWKAATGPILEGDFLMGETYDAREELGGWCTASFNDMGWQSVDVAEKTDAKVQSYPGVLVHKYKETKPISVTQPTEGAYVFDMGTNFAGFVRLKVKGRPGTKVVLRFAERLNEDGTIYTTNLRGARATDTYICKSGQQEVWQPRFTFHGFQYVEVMGYPGQPGLDAVTGIELTSATPEVGQFACSDEMANTLYRNIRQTQRANFIDIPTDCPQRDERLGWTGDAQIYVRTATYNCDVAAFFTKWLVDLEDAQLPNGAFPDVAPRKVAMGGGTAAWGDAGVVCPWTMYQVYGDTRVLEKHYDAMARWIEYCKGTTKGLLRPAQGYGDWLSIKADTPKDVLATAYFAYSTKLMAQIATVLGKKADADKYSRLFDDIKKAFNDAYVSRDAKIKGDTQTVYVLALAFDLLPQGKRGMARQRLLSDIRSKDWHLSTGFVGTKDLMATLTRIGEIGPAYRLFHNDTFPSWGFSIRHGATSIWERWDGWTPEKGFQDPGMNSFAHYSFGAVGEWMFKTIAGIDTEGPAYKQIIIRPRPGGRLTWAKAQYNSIQGLIATDWRIEGRTLTLNVTIPANTMAAVYVPALGVETITESGKPAVESKDLQYLGIEDGAGIFIVGSGAYQFTSEVGPQIKPTRR